ncbi:hypothetical protein PAMP_021297 [Pampus punctatissimus]
MPPGDTFLTAPSITMAALYITSHWLTAAELVGNLHTYLAFSSLPRYGDGYRSNSLQRLMTITD